MLVLGAVQEIRDFDVSVSLPGNMCGTVTIGNVSDLLTKEVLDDMVEKEETEDEENKVREVGWLCSTCSTGMFIGLPKCHMVTLNLLGILGFMLKRVKYSIAVLSGPLFSCVCRCVHCRHCDECSSLDNWWCAVFWGRGREGRGGGRVHGEFISP